MALSRNHRDAGRSADFRDGLAEGLDQLSAMVGGACGMNGLPPRHTRLASGMIAAGLLAAALSPLALLVPGAATVLPLVLCVAVVFLALAAGLKAGMDVDLVLVGLHLAGSTLIGLVALSLDTLWPLALVAIGPIEAWSAGARLRAKLMAPAVMAAFGLTGFLSIHGMGPAGQGLAGTAIALPLCAAYATFVICRAFYGARGEVGGRTEEGLIAVIDADGMLVRRGQGSAEPFAHQLHLLDRVAFLRALDALRAGASARSETLRLREGHDVFRTASLRLEPVRSSNGQLEAVRLVETRAAPSREAPDGEGLRSAFIATVSHEIRTP